MQTFLCDYSFTNTARSLDQKRLVKQLLEGRQIVAALAGQTAGWVNHPATKMWAGHHATLYTYLLAIAAEMQRRGYKYENNMQEINRLYSFYLLDQPSTTPDWMIDELQFFKVVSTHRRALYLKDPEYYSQYADWKDCKNLTCCDRCNYYWPTHVKDLNDKN